MCALKKYIYIFRNERNHRFLKLIQSLFQHFGKIGYIRNCFII